MQICHLGESCRNLFSASPTQSCHSRAQEHIYSVLYNPKFLPKAHFFPTPNVSFLARPNAGCCEKAKKVLWLFVMFLWWFQKDTRLSLSGCQSPAESFSLTQPTIAMHGRAAAVMSQAIQGHPWLPSPLWLTSMFFPPPVLLSLSLSLHYSFTVCYSRIDDLV